VLESLLKMPIFKPEPGLMFWTVISFAVLFLVLAKLGYKPILDIIKKREDGIRHSIDEADRVRNEAEVLFQDYKKQLDEARKEAQAILEQGKQMGDGMKTEIVDRAQKEADGIVKQAKAEISRERAKAVAELEAKITDLTVLTTAKVVQQTLTSQDHLRLIEESLAEVRDVVES
jgi:F-type H+-transporting ATPase subunit b